MANHYSILAWRITWTGEPGGLQSMGWHRVGRGWASNNKDNAEWCDIAGRTCPWFRLGFHALRCLYGLRWTFLVVQLVKNLPANAEDARTADLIPGSGRSPGERNGNSFQYSCLENSMDRGAWRATVHGIAEWNMTEHACTHICGLR